MSGRLFDGCAMVTDRRPATAPPTTGTCRVCGATARTCNGPFGGTCCEGCRADRALAHPEVPGPRLAGLRDQLLRRRCRGRLARPLLGVIGDVYFGRCDLVHHHRAVPHALERGMHWTRWFDDSPRESWVDLT